MPRNYLKQSKIDAEFAFLNTPEKNSQNCSEIMNSPHQNIGGQVGHIFPSGYQFIRCEHSSNSFVLALIDTITNSIVYYVQANVWEDICLSSRPVTQIIVWRTLNVIHQPVTSGLAKDVFFNYLLNKYDIIASDTHQTLMGRAFWIQQVGYALLQNLHTYRYELTTGDLVPILSQQALIDNSADIWGDSESYEYILLLISKNQLKTN